MSGLADRFGRVATDLRVSLTDRCNLRCAYCMPPEGLPWLPTEDVLRDEEIVRLVRVAVERLGVTEVRFTGGEPLLRPGLVDIVAAVAALRPRPQLSLTTNGIGLARQADPLRAAGLDRVNVSLDTLRPDRFVRLAHRRRLDDTLAGLAAATAAGLGPVKVNSVLVRGINDDEAPDLLWFALAHGYELRFIEQMPLDAGHHWVRDQMVTAEEILAALEAEFTLLPDPTERGGAPAETWLIAAPLPLPAAALSPATASPDPLADRPANGSGDGRRAETGPSGGSPAWGVSTGQREASEHDARHAAGGWNSANGSSDGRRAETGATGGIPDGRRGRWEVGAAIPSGMSGAEPGGELPRVGVIASVTRPFCRDCDRTRLTADGQVRACLFSREETDLRGLLRGGGSDDEIADQWRAAMWGKRAGHGIDDPGFLQPTRPMSAIGG